MEISAATDGQVNKAIRLADETRKERERKKKIILIFITDQIRNLKEMRMCYGCGTGRGMTKVQTSASMTLLSHSRISNPVAWVTGLL